MLRIAILTVIAVATVCGQEQGPATPAQPPPPVLENTGQPMLAPFQCTDEDIHSAGLTCTEDDPCQVYLELSAVESAGERIFAAGNIHAEAATLYSVLLGSEDGGHTWRELHERIRGAGIDHIQFIDRETGFASGLSLSPLSQDPFLLISSDGGKTWRQHAIFDETRIGSIQQFSFDERKTGSLIIDRGLGSDGDRYELYESPDGGDSWTIKQTSVKPLTLKHPPAVSSVLRLRADGPSKSFHIERRQGERWNSVAAFAVKLGVCKP
jgi:hypothetical protein